MSVLGAYYVQAAVVLGPAHWREALPLTAVAVSLPIGALITNILIIDDIRDRDFDVVKGKNTIAVRFGKTWNRAEFVCLLASLTSRRSGFGFRLVLPPGCCCR